MDNLITEIGAALEYYAGQERENAAEMGCSAGNFDGGSAETCEHCQALAGAAHLERLLSGLASAARLATEIRTLEVNKRHVHIIPSEYGDRWIASTNGGNLRVSAETFDGVLLALGAALREAGEKED